MQSQRLKEKELEIARENQRLREKELENEREKIALEKEKHASQERLNMMMWERMLNSGHLTPNVGGQAGAQNIRLPSHQFPGYH